MCDFGLIGIAAGLASSVVGAAGAMQQGDAAQAAADYNAQIARQNATIAQQRAQDALVRGDQNTQTKMSANAQQIGQLKAKLAAGGADVNFGSPAALIVDSTVAGKVDALTIKSNSYREARDDQINAMNANAQAGLYTMQGQSAAAAGGINALGSILGGVGNAFSSYQKNYSKASA